MKTKIGTPLVGAFVATLAAPLISSAASITYNPEFNLDEAAVAPSYAISANTVTAVESGISDGTLSTSYSFSDATTGLAFSFDLNYSGTVDSNSSTRIELVPGESAAIAFGTIIIDTSGYIDGTIGGITGPVNATVTSAGFDYFLAESFSNAGSNNPYNILTIDDGTGSLTSYTTNDDPLEDAAIAAAAPVGATIIDLPAGNQDITLAGTTTNSIAFTSTQDINGAVRLSDLGSSIIFEVTAIPEPSSAALLFGVTAMAFLGLRRR